MDVPTAEELAKSQADLNEYLAYIIMGEAFNELRYVYRALDALAFHNLAAGFTAEFSSEKPPRDLEGRQRCARRAVNAVHWMDIMSRRDDIRARDAADDFQGWVPDDPASLSTAHGGALVYLITHARLAAAKVGIADMSGSRLAQHRRNGWQILAVFQVSAKSAAAIETNVLKWWRVALGLPSYLTPSQMPQGGWTETVAASRIDLTETMTRICKLAVASPPPGPYVPGRVRG